MSTITQNAKARKAAEKHSGKRVLHVPRGTARRIRRSGLQSA